MKPGLGIFLLKDGDDNRSPNFFVVAICVVLEDGGGTSERLSPPLPNSLDVILVERVVITRSLTILVVVRDVDTLSSYIILVEGILLRCRGDDVVRAPSPIMIEGRLLAPSIRHVVPNSCGMGWDQHWYHRTQDLKTSKLHYRLYHNIRRTVVSIFNIVVAYLMQSLMSSFYMMQQLMPNVGIIQGIFKI